VEIINENKIVKYIYDTGYEQFEGKTRDEAAINFENWINNNTPYRGIVMFAKHQGYNLIFEDEYGTRYTHNGMTTYRIDEYGNLIEEV